MNTITPAELLTLVIQYAALKGLNETPIDETLIREVVLLVHDCGTEIATYRAIQKL